jgi:hypothetical protein
MTIRKQWMLALVVSAALSVIVNSLVLNIRINQYFVDYSTENYNSMYRKWFSSPPRHCPQTIYVPAIEMQLTSHLSDPITRFGCIARTVSFFRTSASAAP